MLKKRSSDSTVTTARASTLHGTNDGLSPVLYGIGKISDGITVRDEIPAACTVAVVVEPRTEDEVGGNEHEKTASD